MAHIARKYAQFVSRTKLNKKMTMGTLRMCYEYFFRIFTKSLLLNMHISTVSILQIVFLDKLFFLNFYQFRPYYEFIHPLYNTNSYPSLIIWIHILSSYIIWIHTPTPSYEFIFLVWIHIFKSIPATPTITHMELSIGHLLLWQCITTSFPTVVKRSLILVERHYTLTTTPRARHWSDHCRQLRITANRMTQVTIAL